MVKNSTLFHRVDGFSSTSSEPLPPEFLDQILSDRFLNDLLGPLVYDPGEEVVQAILKKV